MASAENKAKQLAELELFPSHRSPSVERFRIHVKGMERPPGWLDGFPEVGRCRSPWRRRWAKDSLDASTEGENNSLRATFAFCALFFVVTVVLPVGQLLIGSFFKFFGLYQWDMLTLEHYQAVFGSSEFWRGFDRGGRFRRNEEVLAASRGVVGSALLIDLRRGKGMVSRVRRGQHRFF
jgi:hypothetical protein